MGRKGRGWEETQGEDGLLPTKEKSLEQIFSTQPSGSISIPHTLIFSLPASRTVRQQWISVV